MSNTENDGDRHERSDHRYAGWKGTARIIGEVLIESVYHAKDDLVYTGSVIRGSADIKGETCQLEGCERTKVGKIPSTDDWKDDWDACRFHWLVFWGIARGFWVVVYLGSLTLLLWMVMA